MFPELCPCCLAPTVHSSWAHPLVKGTVYPRYIEHFSGCWIYLERAFMPWDGIAHLVSLSLVSADDAREAFIVDDDRLKGRPIPEFWTRNVGEARRPLEVGMEVRMPNGAILPVLKVNSCGATVRGLPRTEHIGGKPVKTNGPPSQISLYAEVEYRHRQRHQGEWEGVDDLGSGVLQSPSNFGTRKDTHMAENEVADAPTPAKDSVQSKAAAAAAKLRAKKEANAAAIKADSKPNGKPAKEKKEPAPVVLQPCVCGCGNETKRFFYPGHDSKFKSWLLKIAKGESKPKDLLTPELVKALGPWTPTADGKGVAPSKHYSELR